MSRKSLICCDILKKPDRICAGTTQKWLFYDKKFPSEEWRGTIVLKSGSKVIKVVGEVSEDEPGCFIFKISADITAGLKPGDWCCAFVVEMLNDDGEVTERHCVEESIFCVTPDPMKGGLSKIDEWTECLEKIDEAIGGVESYSIETMVGKRDVKNMSMDELLKVRAWANRQLNKEKAKQGKGNNPNRWRRIRTCF